MKLKGKKISGPNIEVVVLPRGQGEDLVFKCQAVLNMDDFDKLCPRPKAPIVIKKGGIKVEDVEDKGYQQELIEYAKKRMAWMVITSLRATDELEWETVDFGNQDTWAGYEKELRDAGLAEMEVARIVAGVMNANALNEERIQEARERFFTSTHQGTETSPSPTGEPNSTSSGEPASA